MGPSYKVLVAQIYNSIYVSLTITPIH